jgi:hypothetical protein
MFVVIQPIAYILSHLCSEEASSFEGQQIDRKWAQVKRALYAVRKPGYQTPALFLRSYGGVRKLMTQFEDFNGS